MQKKAYADCLSLSVILMILLSLSISGCKESTPEPAARPVIAEGMTLDEVKNILGAPSGTMSVSNQTTLLYHGVMLKFVEGKLVTPPADIMQRIDQARERRPAPFVAKKQAKPSPEKKAPPSEKPQKRMSHPVLQKAERAMYDAERAAHDRARAVYGGTQGDDDFPSYEQWQAER